MAGVPRSDTMEVCSSKVSGSVKLQIKALAVGRPMSLIVISAERADMGVAS